MEAHNKVVKIYDKIVCEALDLNKNMPTTILIIQKIKKKCVTGWIACPLVSGRVDFQKSKAALGFEPRSPCHKASMHTTRPWRQTHTNGDICWKCVQSYGWKSRIPKIKSKGGIWTLATTLPGECAYHSAMTTNLYHSKIYMAANNSKIYMAANNLAEQNPLWIWEQPHTWAACWILRQL